MYVWEVGSDHVLSHVRLARGSRQLPPIPVKFKTLHVILMSVLTSFLAVFPAREHTAISPHYPSVYDVRRKHLRRD